jgi:heptosyltransferase-1
MSDHARMHALPGDHPRILIVKMWDLGDILTATPLLRALRKRYPEAEIHWLCDSAYALLLVGNPMIDRVIAFDSVSWRAELRCLRLPSYLRRTLWLRRELIAEGYDLVINLAADKWWSIWFGVAPKSIGVFSRARPGLPAAVHAIAVAPSANARMHDARRYLLAADALGIEGPHDEQMVIGISSDHRRAAHSVLRSEPAYMPDWPIVVLHPGAPEAAKRWPLNRYAMLVDRLTGFNVAVTGSSHDRIFAERIAAACRRQIVIAAGRLRGVAETAALIERASAVVAGDTSVLHIASALDVPIVGIYGCTRPGDNTPLCGRAEFLYDDKTPCGPCRKSECPRTRSKHMACMQAVTVDNVMDALNRLGVSGDSEQAGIDRLSS